MKVPVKILETAKIALGILVPISVIWNFDVPFDVDRITNLLTIIIGIIGGTTLAVSGVRGYIYAKASGASRYAND